MILYFLLLSTFFANVWLGWSLGSWIGIATFLAFIPLSIILMVGGGLALGLVGMIFGKHNHRSR